MRETDKNDKTTMLRGKNILKIASFFSIFLMLFNIAYFDLANAAVNDVKGIPAVEITDIELSDHTIIIKANSPLSYSIYKASDPFTVVVDIEGVRLGKFTQKISSKSLGVTEIRPSQVTSPILLSRLEILLSEPSDIIPQMKDGSLTLRIKAEDPPVKEVVAAATANSAKKITAVKFEKTADSLEMAIKGNGSMPEPDVNETENSLILFIPNVKMAASLPEKIPSPIKDIKYNAEKGGVMFQVNFDTKIDSLAFAFGDEVIIDISYKTASPKKQETAQGEGIKDPAIAVNTDANQPPQQNNSKLISLDFQDADVTAILRLLADVSGKNIIIHPEVKGKTSMKLVNVHWEQALDVVTKTHNLYTIVDGNIIRIEPYAVFVASNEGIAKVKESIRKAEPQETKVFIANYANIEKFKESLEKSKILTKDTGSVSIDTRTRSITIKDTPTVLIEAAKLLESIDKPTKQILIEARIVELNTTLSRSLGIEWGLKMRPFNWESTVVGSAAGALTGGLGAPGLVNLPAATGRITDPTSAFTVGYLNRNQTFGLDMRLSAIENTGRGKIISKPKVITGDNQKAKIVQGESIPYGERDKEGQISTKFKDVAITIEVTPQITDDNNILLDVLVNKEDLIEFVNIGGVPPTLAPRTTKLEGKTNVMIENGETMVIGGIYKKDERSSEERVPGFASIPLVGELFKKRIKDDDVKEFIIFITPKVVQR